MSGPASATCSRAGWRRRTLPDLWLPLTALPLRFFRVWPYPHQSHRWELVHGGKLGSWALLAVVSLVLVANWKQSQLRDESRGAEAARTAGPARPPLPDSKQTENRGR